MTKKQAEQVVEKIYLMAYDLASASGYAFLGDERSYKTYNDHADRLKAELVILLTNE